MKNKIILSGLFLLMVFLGFARETAEFRKSEPYDGPIVKYLIEAQLIPEARRLVATEVLTWHNNSSHPVDHLRFHLYYNAFRNIKTTFLDEARYYKKSRENRERLKFGEIKIKEIRMINGEDLTEKIRFISPDDNNKEDRTVMEFGLGEPVNPGESVRIKIEFDLTIPQIFARTGVEGDYFFMAQWFPKIGVLQGSGQWHCHQFHYNSEFFSDYGEYRVALTVPGKFIVGACGYPVKTEKNADGSFTYFYEEKNIHDFAWAASPHFTKITEKIKLKGNKEESVIELLLSPGHSAVKHRYLEPLKFAMQFFARHIFPYPYKKITVVDPPLKAFMSMGMEYPTLITSSYTSLLPGALRLTEATTVHEFAHQYWYGIVGTDEFREAWLDEGVTAFFEGEILSEYFKNSASFLDSVFLKIRYWEAVRAYYASILPVSPVNQPAWKFLNPSQYGGNVYAKASAFFKSLKNLVGKARMYNFFKFYAEKYKYKHPGAGDFIDTFNTFMGEDFSWAFDLFIKGEGGLDHSVHSMESVKISSNPDIYRNEAVFLRKEGYFPVDLVITLESGKEITSFWKEKEKWKRIVFNDSSPIKEAALDPLGKVILDRNFLDNSIRRRPDRSGIKRLALKIGFLFQNVLGFFVM